MRTFSASLVAVSLLTWLSGPVKAQGAVGIFKGTVTHDSSRAPLEEVEVHVDGVGTTRTSARGTFTFPSVAPGLYKVTLRRPGYGPIEGNVRVNAGETTDLLFAIWAVRTDLPTVQVTGEAAALNIGLVDFEKRRAYGLGKFLTPEDFRGRDNASLRDVLETNVPGLLLVHVPNGGFAVASKHNSAPVSLTPRGSCNTSNIFCVPLVDACYMAVWVDGQRIYTSPRPGSLAPPPPNMEAFSVMHIAGVEIYRGPAETPLQFSTPGSQCGAVVIWTGRHP